MATGRLRFALAGATCLCALASTPLPAATQGEPAQAGTAAVRVHGQGFTMLVPTDGWKPFPSGVRGALSYAKVDATRAERFREGGSLVLGAITIAAHGHDIRTPGGLREAIQEFVAASDRRFTPTRTELAHFVERDSGTDCFRLETESQERDNRHQPAKVLLLTTVGVMCRHPTAPAMMVQLACSERRVAGMPEVADEKTRKECEDAVASLRFEPRD